MEKEMVKKGIILVILLFTVGIISFMLGNKIKSIPTVSIPGIPGGQTSKPQQTALATFASVKEFKDYLLKQPAQSFGFGGFEGGIGSDVVTNGAPMEKSSLAAPMAVGGQTADRISQTNVQVAGIDEPDIVKTDGTEIYYSGETPLAYFDGPERILNNDLPAVSNESPASAQGKIGGSAIFDDNAANSMPFYPQQKSETKIIKAFPPSELATKKISTIDKQGDLLLSNNTLVVFSNQQIYGYDVTDPKNPSQKWKADLSDNNSLLSARMYQDKVYVVTRMSLNYITPCPIQPMTMQGTAVSIRCDQIYHPIAPTSSDVTYNIMKIDMKSGAVENTTSFVGSSNESTVYMSTDSIYVTNAFTGNIVSFMFNFLKENGGLIPQEIVDRIGKLDGYDISDASKMTELGMLLEQYQSSLNNDDRLKIENEMQNKMAAYAAAHLRELEKTGIAKIQIKDFKVSANGEVPGRVLNQYSMDEYAGNLRVATTIGGGWLGFGIGSGQGGSVSDVNILDKDLKNLGSVQDLGKGERIYSARFVEDKGYIVTFKQIDPFFVLDLSNPKNPQLKGELKIPGYSSYLHPIAKNVILGIGKENNMVKLSLFDVSDASNPIEMAKYNLDEYYTEIENNPRAFLQDEKHQVFFIPGSQGGYVFSYAGNTLTLKKAISDYSIKRALYLNDYLYVIGDQKISVFNENYWTKVSELEL